MSRSFVSTSLILDEWPGPDEWSWRPLLTGLLPDEPHLDRKVEISPHAVSGEDLSRCHASSQGETTPIAKRKLATAFDGAQGTGELGVGDREWFHGDSSGAEQHPQTANIDIGIDKLADHLSQIRRTKNCTLELPGHKVMAGFAVNKSQDRRRVQDCHS